MLKQLNSISQSNRRLPGLTAAVESLRVQVLERDASSVLILVDPAGKIYPAAFGVPIALVVVSHAVRERRLPNGRKIKMRLALSGS